MEALKQQVQQLEVQEQRQLLVELVVGSAPETQLSLLLPSVTAASSYVKWRLVTNLQGQDTPDLLVLLPPELQLAVLLYLDGSSLLNATQVSRIWNSIIKGHSDLWMKQCRRLGVNMSKVPGWVDWHSVYVASLRQQTRLSNGTAFSERFMQLQNCKKAVKAVDYKDGFLCTVSEEDYINIWLLDMNIPVLTFPVERAVSCIKFRPNSLLLCGHFVGILTSWDLSGMTPSRCAVWEHSVYNRDHDRLKNKFKMHAGPVFSSDFSEELDLLVSGGADECLKLWSLSSGLQVKSLSNQDHWVLKVILIPDLSLTSTHEIVYMTRENVKKISWPSVMKWNSNKCEVKESDDHSSALSVQKYGIIEKICVNCNISLNEGHSNFFTPGLQFSSKYFGIIKQDVEEKHANLCVYDIEKFKLVHNISLNIKVKKLLALGNRYALILTMGSVLYSSTLVIIDIITRRIIGTHSIPHSKMTTPDGAQLVVGDAEWLDGLGVHLPGSAVQFDITKNSVHKGCISNAVITSGSIQKGSRKEITEKCVKTKDQNHIESMNLQQNLINCPEKKKRLENDPGQPVDQSNTTMNQVCVDAPCCAQCDDQAGEAVSSDCTNNECRYLWSDSASDVLSALRTDNASEVQSVPHLEHPSFLVLAAGVLNEPGRLFTLWWAQSRHTHKCKEE